MSILLLKISLSKYFHIQVQQATHEIAFLVFHVHVSNKKKFKCFAHIVLIVTCSDGLGLSGFHV